MSIESGDTDVPLGDVADEERAASSLQDSLPGMVEEDDASMCLVANECS